MIPEHRSAIVDYLGENPDSNIRAILESTKIERGEIYAILCELERKHKVHRHGGLDGTTITFFWNLLD